MRRQLILMRAPILKSLSREIYRQMAAILRGVPIAYAKWDMNRHMTEVGSAAREGSGFTLLFEALVMLLCQEMPMAAVADTLQEHDTRL